jgi:hypothetical protein
MSSAILGAFLFVLQVYESELPLDHPAIRYREEPAEDPVAGLAGALERGEASLEFDPAFSYLPSLLERLRVPRDSQTLVFSKTSVQEARISPRNPRAIYFRDDVLVAYVPGAESIEMAGVDPRKGAVFYSLEAKKTEKPRIARTEGCLHCHLGPATLGVPGIYVGSVSANPSGRADFRLFSIVTDHRTPFAERWGGWYVNGTLGEIHRGNAVASDPDFTSAMPPPRAHPGRHLSPESDVVALMTLEHQTQMTNLLTRLSWEARIDADGDLSARVEEVVRYMLFLDEAPLGGPIRGASSFSETFPREGPRDRKGRSLRDFDLEKRLFKYPLSYMVYSRHFDGLPERARDRVRRRLRDMLNGEREVALSILRDTKPGFFEGME